MKLEQGQVWKNGGEFLRIVNLQRLEVEYKSLVDPNTRDGTHLRASKKDFCRLLKGATLLPKAPAPAVGNKIRVPTPAR